ncbi:caspase family protein [uncultured Sphingobacterium sp.]|uniref:caspase family protein n=1 Tax=uncultured Sphingobacterium sp. TaxID=182688 RepID=UPI0037495BCC
MSLLFNDVNGNIPQTHVFIIGVGGYPYIKGGTEEKKQTLDCAKKLGQLTSPPLSAKALYDTIINLHNQDAWIKPLGSVEILISPVGADPFIIAGEEVGRADMENITDSFNSWLERCDSSADNVTLFFFCGHGVDKAEHILLTEDFGKNPVQPWSGSFAFDKTRLGFFRCQASTQLFFIDACRLFTADMLLTEVPLYTLIPQHFNATDCRFNLTQKAAAHNEGAYGEINDVSFYTKALIKALEGGVLKKKQDEWTITLASLATKMDDLLEMVSEQIFTDQRCSNRIGKSTDILRFTEAPNIDVVIDCSPEEAHNLAHLSYFSVESKEKNHRLPNVDPWKVHIKPGIYELKADFPNGQYENKNIFESFMPPAGARTLKCEQ